MINLANFALRRVALAGAVVSAMAVALVAGTGSAYAAQPALAQGHAALVGNDLSVHGTSGDDDIQISLADPTHVQVDFNDGRIAPEFDISAFSAITVNLGDGNDRFAELPSGGVLATKPLVVFGGAGNDTIQGGDANDTLFGGDGNDNIQGGDGADVIFAGAGNDVVNGNHGNDTEILGDGNDTAVWNPGEGSDAVGGGTGNDKLVFNGASVDESMSLTADGHHAVFARDPGAVRMDLVHVERIDVAALAGADRITVGDLTGTGLTQADLNLAAPTGGPDGQLDVVNVTGTNHADDIAVGANSAGVVSVTGLYPTLHIAGADSFDQLEVNTLLGKDRATVSPRAGADMNVNVSFGAVRP